MKRVQERWNCPHPQWEERLGLSGLKEFDGEDLTSDDRERHFRQMQKKWFDEQKKEKEIEKEARDREEHMFAMQTLEVTRMRGMLEDRFKQQKTAINCAHTGHNLNEAQSKREREELEKQQRIAEERAEVQRLLQRGVARPYQ